MTLPPPARPPAPNDPIDRIVDSAKKAAKRLQETLSGEELRQVREQLESLQPVRAELEALKQETAALRERISVLEERIPPTKAESPVAPAPAQRQRAPRAKEPVETPQPASKAPTSRRTRAP